MANVLRNVLVFSLIALIAAAGAFAGSTGKVRGKLTNKKDKSAVPFAVVQIDGTTMGAQADANGEFMIINVPPGIYSITAQLAGWGAVKTTNVEVRVDATAEVNFVMEESVIETEAQIVVAERDLLRVGETSDMRQITAESIKNMPVSTVADLLKVQVGVVERFGQIHFQGGRSNEVSYVVDGVQVKDPLGGRGAVDQAMNLSNNVVEDLQIIKGGYDAEYGNATSGIVNITTKAGSAVTHAELEYLTDDFGTNILRKSSNNFDRVEFNLGGPDPIFSNNILPKLGINWFTDKVFYSIQAAGEKTDDYVSYKDYFTSATQRSFKSRSILGLFNLNDRMQNSYEAHVSVRYEASPNIRLNFRYNGSWDNTTTFDWAHIYVPAYAPVVTENTSTYSAQLTHQIDKSTYYTVQFSRYNRDYTEKPGDPDNPGEGKVPGDFLQADQYETFQDRNGNGKFDSPEPFINANGDTTSAGNFYTFGDAFDVFLRKDDNGDPIIGYWPEYSYDDGTSSDRPVNGRYQGMHNSQGDDNSVDTILTDWNGNGVVDLYDSEQFVDLNGDGKWNAGDVLTGDTNGNGVYDLARADVTNVDVAEPYTDGDLVLGEPFTDVNLNGVYDAGIDIFTMAVDPAVNQDLNRNSRYDSPTDPWLPGTPFRDLNGNG
ncbi:MAG: carboxypeptidase regulatory-like domain-containing protein, partial [Candidatus Zixiibacteriota bacterium]